MKRIASLICAFALVLSLVACGGGPSRPTMSFSEYAAICTPVNYETLARNTVAYDGAYISVHGRVFQVVDAGSYYVYMLDMNTGWDFSQHVYVTFPKGGVTILENDYVTIYGQGAGTQTYVTVLGAQRTIPKVEGAYITYSNSNTATPLPNTNNGNTATSQPDAPVRVP